MRPFFFPVLDHSAIINIFVYLWRLVVWAWATFGLTEWHSVTLLFITSIFKSLVVLVIWLALIGAIYSRIAPFFALNCIFFPANEVATLKTKQPIRFQGLFKVTNQIAGKWKTKSIMRQILLLMFLKLLFFPPPKMDEFNFKRAQYCINKI